MTSLIRIALVAWLMLAAPAPTRAEDTGAMCPICTRTRSHAYGEKAGSTLARGAANALLGWTELIAQPASEAKRGGNLAVGLGKGVSQGAMRTFGGVAEVLTFWMPKVENEYLHFSEDCPLCMKRGGGPAPKP